MWIPLSLMLMLALTMITPISGAGLLDQDARAIVPGERIGLAHLGMTRAAIAAVDRDSLCPVLATYDASGHAVRLETNWGGGCLISDRIQVGLPFGPALRAFGTPDRIEKDARYPYATAFWITYRGPGVAFRVLRWPTGTLIQSIGVFPGIAAHVGCGVRSKPNFDCDNSRSPTLAAP